MIEPEHLPAAASVPPAPELQPPVETPSNAVEFTQQELVAFKGNLTKTLDVLISDMKGIASHEAMACKQIQGLLISEQSDPQKTELQSLVVETFAVITAEFFVDAFPSGQKVVQFEQLNPVHKKALTDRVVATAVQIVATVQLGE